MEYQVLARKWRPMTFADMIGQEHITRTLQNALVNQKTAHAYLFVGPRGIGKTTVARIFAKALNCEKAPIKNPCCECDSCVSIADGSNIDIIEIDGASNNSVNDIRNLRDEALYSPVKSRYKVYIIDEVHMLSNSAWNALLKTLEEPPAHVKFLFATTEVHKILPTVLSRCQRFDLRRIPEKLIVERLCEIAKAEKVNVSPNAIRAIARAADGGMRDALSLMDQMIAFHLSDDSGEISEEQILNTFGLTAPDKIFNLTKAVLSNDQSHVILAINEQANQGKNLESLFQDIMKYLRGIEVCMLISDADSILEVGPDIIEKYKILGSQTKLNTVQSLLETLSSSGKYLHDAINKQIYIETLLLKSMKQANSKRIEDLLEKINTLRKAGKLSDLEINLPDITEKKNLIEIDNLPVINSEKEKQLNKTPEIQKEVNHHADSEKLIQKPVEEVKSEQKPPVETHYEQTEPIKNEISEAVAPEISHPVKNESEDKELEAETSLSPENTQSDIEEVMENAEVNNIQIQTTADKKPEIDFFTGKNIKQDNIQEKLIAHNKKDEKLKETDESDEEELKSYNNLDSKYNIDDYLAPSTPTISYEREEFDDELEENYSDEPYPEQVYYSEKVRIPEVKSEKKTELKLSDFSHQKVKDSPEKLWHKLILEMDNINQPQIKFYLQEAKPVLIEPTSITISYDEEFGSIPAERVNQEKDIINKCLQRITGVNTFKFNVIKEKGISAPKHKIETKDLDEVKRKVESNPFVRETIKVFKGRIVDFRG